MGRVRAVVLVASAVIAACGESTGLHIAPTATSIDRAWCESYPPFIDAVRAAEREPYNTYLRNRALAAAKKLAPMPPTLRPERAPVHAFLRQVCGLSEARVNDLQTSLHRPKVPGKVRPQAG